LRYLRLNTLDSANPTPRDWCPGDFICKAGNRTGGVESIADRFSIGFVTGLPPHAALETVLERLRSLLGVGPDGADVTE